MYLPKNVERELKKSYGTVIFCQIVAAITVFVGICILLHSIDTGGGVPSEIGMLISICMIITAILMYLITQLVDDSRRSSILLRHLLLEQINHHPSLLSSEEPDA